MGYTCRGRIAYFFFLGTPSVCSALRLLTDKKMEQMLPTGLCARIHGDKACLVSTKIFVLSPPVSGFPPPVSGFPPPVILPPVSRRRSSCRPEGQIWNLPLRVSCLPSPVSRLLSPVSRLPSYPFFSIPSSNAATTNPISRGSMVRGSRQK